MKKTYVSPSVEVINIQATQLMASSPSPMNVSDTEVNTSGNGVQLGRDNNGSSSIWDQEW